MILEFLMGFAIWILEKIMFFELPSLPDGVMGYIDTFFEYLASGAGILANYVPFDYIMTLLACIVSIEVILAGYHFIMWILEKIPVLDIDR